MIVSKAKFYLQIFVTTNRVQNATSVGVGAVLRKEGLGRAMQHVSKGICYNLPGFGHCMLFQTKLKVELFNNASW